MGVPALPARGKKGALEVLTLFREVASTAGWDRSRIDRATESTVIDFVADDNDCPKCGEPLGVLKTRTRTILTLFHGSFAAREIIRVCKAAGHDSTPSSKSQELASLVPPFQRFGWDLIVYVGLRRFLFFRQRSELQEELRREYRIEVSTGTISALSDRFLDKLDALHVHRASELRAAMSGGYSLHIDSTNDTGRGGLFVCLDGLRGWVLNAGRITSERAELLTPIVDETVKLFGYPIATVRDMSKACAAAVESLRNRGIPDFICQYHFVADIGSDLLRRNHDRMKLFLKIARVTDSARQILTRAKASAGDDSAATSPSKHLAALVYWVLYGNGRKIPAFPFGLPHLQFYERLRSARDVAKHWFPGPWSDEFEQGVENLEDVSKRLEEERGFKTTVRELLSARRLFDELREILRLEADPCQARQPLLPEVEVDARAAIQKQLDAFVAKLQRRAPPRQLYDKSPDHVVLDHIRRYRQRLFGHPAVRDEDGQVIHVVDRTNNALENLFGTNKRGMRRRTGRKHLTRDLEDLPPKAVLVENLRDPAYVRVLCGSLDNLPDAFACLQSPASKSTDLRPRPDAELRKEVSAFCKALHVQTSPPIEARCSSKKLYREAISHPTTSLQPA